MILLTEQQIADRLQEISQVRMALDPDPTANGLGSLNRKLSEIQLHKDRVSYLVTEALHNSNLAEIEHTKVQGDYDRQLQTLMATDSTVMAGKSAEARTSLANQKMPQLVLKVHDAKVEMLKASGYLNVLKNIYSNLESCNSNLSRQITVLQLSTQIGEVQRTPIQSGHLTKTQY